MKMRIPIALALYVSLATLSHAGQTDVVRTNVIQTNVVQPDSGEASSVQWRKTYDAGMEASQRRDNEEALSLFQQSWNTAGSDMERGAVATNIAQTYRRLGRLKDAALWYKRALDLWSLSPADGFMMAAASVNVADLLRIDGDYAASEAVLRKSLVCSTCTPAARAIVRNNLGDLLREEGRVSEAAPLFHETADDPAATSQYRAGALIGLADIDRQNHAWQSSIARWNEALDLTRHDQDTTTEAVELRGLAETWLQAGSPARAEPLFRRSLLLMESDPDAPGEQLATAHSGLAQLYRSENKLALAEEEWSRALEIERKAVGEVHPQVAWVMEMLADVYSARGEFSLAIDYSTRASEMMISSFGENSMPLATALTNRALVEERAGRLDDAALDYEHAIAIARAHPGHPAINAAMMERYAALLKNMHRGREARALAIEARSFLPK
jgi:tetratricopeptide (TPR) repeat protein